MKPETVNFLRDFLRDQSGLVIDETKDYLIRSRLTPVAQKHGFETIDDLAMTLMLHKPPRIQTGDPPPPASPGTLSIPRVARDVVEGMATHETSFFRDRSPFDRLKDTVLPHIVSLRSSGTLRIWSAACSTGQETYSIAMLLEENRASLKGRDYRIVGSDISNFALERAQDAKYTRYEVRRGLADERLQKFFDEIEKDRFQVKHEIRGRVRFMNINLLSTPYPVSQCDIIFCRNILIYLDKDARRTVFDGLERALSTGGLLFLGSSESVYGVTEKFAPVPHTHGVFYRVKDGKPSLERAAPLQRSGIGTTQNRGLNR